MQRFFPATLAARLFGAVSLSDLARYRSVNERGKLHQDVASLNGQELVRQRRLMAGKGREKSSFLVLTKADNRALEQLRRQPSQQAFYAALVKPQEAAHDAAIYRMYQAEATQIARQSGVIRRVVLDYELKKKVYSPLAKARALPPLEFAKCQAEVARSNGLKVVEGRIPLPDLRIEYETAEGDLAKVDLELATEHYHGVHTATKAKAGFKIYAHSASASRTNAALTYGRSAVCGGPELTAVILSL
jgi:hypothetical protein